MKQKLKRVPLKPQSNPELVQLANGVGSFIEYWGFKAVQGRMWCYLFLADRPLSSIELSEILEISPALVTQSIQMLLEYRVLVAADKGPNGVLRFTANSNVAEGIEGVLIQRELALLDKVQAASETLKKSKRNESSVSLNPARVKMISDWVSVAKMFLQMGLRSLRKDHSNPFEFPGLYLRNSVIKSALKIISKN